MVSARWGERGGRRRGSTRAELGRLLNSPFPINESLKENLCLFRLQQTVEDTNQPFLGRAWYVINISSEFPLSFLNAFYLFH
jgi:hypothetical protein